jgi:hypothetical protein
MAAPYGSTDVLGVECHYDSVGIVQYVSVFLSQPSEEVTMMLPPEKRCIQLKCGHCCEKRWLECDYNVGMIYSFAFASHYP